MKPNQIRRQFLTGLQYFNADQSTLEIEVQMNLTINLGGVTSVSKAKSGGIGSARETYAASTDASYVTFSSLCVAFIAFRISNPMVVILAYLGALAPQTPPFRSARFSDRERGRPIPTFP